MVKDSPKQRMARFSDLSQDVNKADCNDDAAEPAAAVIADADIPRVGVVQEEFVQREEKVQEEVEQREEKTVECSSASLPSKQHEESYPKVIVDLTPSVMMAPASSVYLSSKHDTWYGSLWKLMRTSNGRCRCCTVCFLGLIIVVGLIFCVLASSAAQGIDVPERWQKVDCFVGDVIGTDISDYGTEYCIVPITGFDAVRQRNMTVEDDVDCTLLPAYTRDFEGICYISPKGTEMLLIDEFQDLVGMATFIPPDAREAFTGVGLTGIIMGVVLLFAFLCIAGIVCRGPLSTCLERIDNAVA